MTREIYIGTFLLWDENVKIYGLPAERGGEFDACPGDQMGQIKIGLNYPNWGQAVSVAVHEILEYILTRQGHRYERSGKFNGDAADYQFWFDHCEFGDACDRLGYTLSNILPKLAETYNKLHKKNAKHSKSKG